MIESAELRAFLDDLVKPFENRVHRKAAEEQQQRLVFRMGQFLDNPTSTMQTG